MELSEQLRHALLNYGAIEKQVSSVGLCHGDQAKLALVRSRRQLSEQIGHLGPLIEQDEILAKEPNKQREMSRLFATVRYALALHQANWPAVRIDEDPSAYRRSAQDVQTKSDAFWHWCGAQLGMENHWPAPESSVS